MPIAFVAAGTADSQHTGTPCAPGLPAGSANDHILVAAIMAGNNDVLTTPNWTQKVAFDNTGIHRLTIAWRRATGSDALSITGNSQDITAQIAGFSGCITTGDPFSAFDTGAASASGTTNTANAITPANANEMILYVGGGSNLGASAINFGSYTGTNPTFSEAFDNAYTGGLVFNLGVFLAYGLKTDTTSTGSRSATITQTADSSSALLSLIAAGGGGGTVKRNNLMLLGMGR